MLLLVFILFVYCRISFFYTAQECDSVCVHVVCVYRYIHMYILYIYHIFLSTYPLIYSYVLLGPQKPIGHGSILREITDLMSV